MHEIDEWEKTKQDVIIQKATILYKGEKILRFLIKEIDSSEFVFCIPYTIEIDNKLVEFILADPNDSHVYYKTLFFGKIDSQICNKISTFLSLIEK